MTAIRIAAAVPIIPRPVLARLPLTPPGTVVGVAPVGAVGGI